MKRFFCFFAALLFALAILITPAVSAAKDWTIKTGDWRFSLFPDSINLKPGDNINILGKSGYINGLGIKGEIHIPPGVSIYMDTGVLVHPGAKLLAGEPLPAKPVNIFGPYAHETIARRGQAEPMSDQNNR